MFFSQHCHQTTKQNSFKKKTQKILILTFVSFQTKNMTVILDSPHSSCVFYRHEIFCPDFFSLLKMARKKSVAYKKPISGYSANWPPLQAIFLLTDPPPGIFRPFCETIFWQNKVGGSVSPLSFFPIEKKSSFTRKTLKICSPSAK